jgi:hypothetical protein
MLPGVCPLEGVAWSVAPIGGHLEESPERCNLKGVHCSWPLYGDSWRWFSGAGPLVVSPGGAPLEVIPWRGSSGGVPFRGSVDGSLEGFPWNGSAGACPLGVHF